MRRIGTWTIKIAAGEQDFKEIGLAIEKAIEKCDVKFYRFDYDKKKDGD